MKNESYHRKNIQKLTSGLSDHKRFEVAYAYRFREFERSQVARGKRPAFPDAQGLDSKAARSQAHPRAVQRRQSIKRFLARVHEASCLDVSEAVGLRKAAASSILANMYHAGEIERAERADRRWRYYIIK